MHIHYYQLYPLDLFLDKDQTHLEHHPYLCLGLPVLENIHTDLQLVQREYLGICHPRLERHLNPSLLFSDFWNIRMHQLVHQLECLDKNQFHLGPYRNLNLFDQFYNRKHQLELLFRCPGTDPPRLELRLSQNPY